MTVLRGSLPTVYLPAFPLRYPDMCVIGTRAIAVLVGVLIASTPQSASSQATQADQSAIRAARDRSNRAIAAHDADGVARVFLPEYVSVSSTNHRTIGRDAGRASFAQHFATRPGVVFVRSPLTITVNTAWGQAGERGEWTGQWRSSDGMIHVRGDYFAKWKKLGGDWRLLTETFVQTSCTGGHYCDTVPMDSDQPVIPGLSHVFVGVDSATFAAIVASPFLRDEFGAFETRTTTRSDGSSYAGAYLYGHETYVELQQPSGDRSASLAQLYLGSDARGDIHQAMDRLAAGSIRTTFGLNTRLRNNVNVPWFYAAGVMPSATEPRSGALFDMTLLEWHPDFLRTWFPRLPADSTGMSRVAYLAPLWAPQRYLRDVVGITFALDSTETARMTERLSRLGFIVRRTADTVVSVGGGLTVTAVPTRPGRHGTAALRFSLQQVKAGVKTFVMGSSELRFTDGLEAIWTFR